MPKLLNSTPKYRRHSSGQAFLQIQNQRCYLGPYGSVASRAEYDRLIGVWLANGRRLPGRPGDDVTVADLIVAYWKHAQATYTPGSGHKGEVGSIKLALRQLKRVAADTPVGEFGPLLLQAVRAQMVTDGWCRRYVNMQVRRVVRAFRWGTSQELVPAGVFQALESVEGLKQGHTPAPESPPVRPVDAAAVEAVLQLVSAPVAAMIKLQQLTGMRPGEVCQMRRGDIDTSDPTLWTYTPGQHKTAHLGHERQVFLGERCRAVLAPFMDRPAEKHLFSPVESESDRLARRSSARRTAAGQGNAPGTNRVKRRERELTDRYTTQSYGHAIVYACDKAFRPPPPVGPEAGESLIAWGRRLTAEQKAELRAWRQQHRWHPHQIRHAFATAKRAKHGLEAPQVLLGHKSLTVTQVYAEKNVKAAKKVMRREG